jgi:GT2 family glycosyltransferase
MSGVDVVVPSYNYARFLRECVESVLTQSHRDLRIVIIDDASSDGTDAVCAALASQDPRIEIHRHAVNQGHIQTYNEGIGLAEGDYMLLLSADDFLLPGALARAVAVLDARPDVGLVYGDYVNYHAGDRLPEPSLGTPEAKYPEASAFLEMQALGNAVGTATAVVRTAVQKRLGGYRVDLPHAGDLEMWLRFALHSRVAQICAPQAVYRRHDANMSLGYDDVADLTQCLASFALHRDDIRDRSPHGAQLERRIHEIFAAKAFRRARRALTKGRIRTFLQINKLRKSEKLLAGPTISSRSDTQRRS